MRTPEGDVAHRSRGSSGAHNLENLLVALGIAHALDLDLGARGARRSSTRGGRPGRLERCDAEGDDVTVLVDYAHTPDALARALDARPRHRRADGSGASSAAAATATPTSARPWAKPSRGAPTSRSSPTTTRAPRTRGHRRGRGGRLARGLSGARAGTGARDSVELDRRTGHRSRRALRPRRGDVVAVAGKGHEDYQIVGIVKHSVRRSHRGAPRARGATAIRRERGRRPEELSGDADSAEPMRQLDRVLGRPAATRRDASSARPRARRARGGHHHATAAPSPGVRLRRPAGRAPRRARLRRRRPSTPAQRSWSSRRAGARPHARADVVEVDDTLVAWGAIARRPTFAAWQRARDATAASWPSPAAPARRRPRSSAPPSSARVGAVPRDRREPEQPRRRPGGRLRARAARTASPSSRWA